ncbi:MAG: protein kinase [Kofleriaceae bacterium]
MGSIEEEIAKAQAEVGRVLADKFRLTACIGLGGTGAVYRAEQIALGRSVAVKILKEEMAADARLGLRFRDEAMAASRLNHPNTVSIIDYGQTPDGLLYLAMEYLKGPTLTQLIAREQPLAPATVLDIVSQILAGIEEAHLAGVVHADLKSDNIIVDQRRAGADVVKIVDFGIARLMNAPAAGEERVTGTPEYMAPEVIGGSPPGYAADLYAVGIIFYELLVGHTPFVGGTTVDILARQLKGEVPSLSAARPDVPAPAEFDALTRRALAKQPGDRFSSAPAMRTAVQALLTKVVGGAPALDLECASCGAQCQPTFRFCPQCAMPRSPTARVATPEPAPRPTIDLRSVMPLPLVGRDAAHAQVAAHLRSITGPRALLVVGPTGVGRTRLIADASVEVAAAGALTLYQVGADPTGLTATYYPVRALLAALLGLPAVCAEADLKAAVRQLGLDDADLFGIAQLFGHASPLAELEPVVRRRETIAATLRVIEAVAAQAPTAIVFDDVDRYDGPSLEVLRRLAEAGPSAPAVVIVVEPAPAAAWPEELPRLVVEPLDEEGVAQIVRHLALDAEVASAATLLAHSGGLPGHVEQLIRFLNEGGQQGEAAMPLADLIAARLSMLPQATLELCQSVAVFGVEADLDVVRASTLVADIDAAVADALDHGLLVEHDEVLRFASVLVRDVVYDATPANVRRALHATAATAIGERAADAYVLGHHHVLAGHAARAVRLLVLAGDHAILQLDELGAAEIYQRALVAVRDALRVGGDDGDDLAGDFVEVSAKLADALRARGDLGLARGVLGEARTWAEGPRAEAAIDRAMAAVAAAEDDHPGAATLLRRAIGKAISGGATNLVVELYVDLANVLVDQGDRAGARRELAEGLDIVTFGEGTTAAGGPSNLWQLIKRKAMIVAALGDFTRALALGEAALAQAQRVEARVAVARTATLLVQLAEHGGQRPLAEHYRRLAVTEMRSLGDRRSTAELLSLARSARSQTA